VLTSNEVELARTNLLERWGIPRSGYWYPVSAASLKEKVQFHRIAVAIHDNPLGLPDGLKILPQQDVETRIREFLGKRGVKRVFELREDGDSYQVDLSLAEFMYTSPGLEGFWFDESDDWVVYCSHESSITLAGTIASIV
jgi:hypothetical protein